MEDAMAAHRTYRPLHHLICVDLHTDMPIDMCKDRCIGMCIDVRIDKCVDMCIHMCIDMCRAMCIVLSPLSSASVAHMQVRRVNACTRTPCLRTCIHLVHAQMRAPNPHWKAFKTTPLNVSCTLLLQVAKF